MNEFINLFAPIRILKFLKEFIVYAVVSIFRFWRTFILILLLIEGIYYYQYGFLHGWFFFLLIVLLPVLVTSFFAVKQDFTKSKKQDRFVAGELECLYIIDNDYFEKNIITDTVNEENKRRINLAKENLPPFTQNIAEYKQLIYPKFYYYLVSPQKLNDSLQKKVDSNQFQTILHISINAKSSKIDVKFYSKANMIMYAKRIHELAEIIGGIEIKDRDIPRFINDIEDLFQSIVAHGFLDSIINAGLYSDAHTLLDENQQVFYKSLKKIKEYSLPESGKLIDRISVFWECEIERYRGVVYAISKNYHSAIKHIFKAIKLNPYYPHDDYESWKPECLSRYATSFGDSLAAVAEDLKNSLDPKILKGEHVENSEIKAAQFNAASQTNYPTILSYVDIITEIISAANSKSINQEILGYIDSEICISPIQEFIKGDIIKFIPIRGEKVNKVYVGRFDSVIEYFESILEIDPDFPLIHNKMGAILLLKYGTPKNQNSELFKKAMFHLEKGLEILTKYGYKIKSDLPK